MTKPLISLAAIAALFAIVGCSSGPESETGEDQEVRGQTCGGFAGRKCPAGSTCRLSANHPDATGSCVKIAAGAEGGACKAGNKCNTGLACTDGTCAKAEDDGDDDASGAGEGARCGGFAGIQCKAGLSCKTPATCCDQMGTCVKR